MASGPLRPVRAAAGARAAARRHTSSIGALGRVIHGSGRAHRRARHRPVDPGGESAPARARARRPERPPPGRRSRRDLERDLAAAPRARARNRRRRAEGRPRAGRHARLRRPAPRGARREPLGRGLRPSVASLDDHARMLAALDSRAGPPAAPHAAAPDRARPRHQPRDRALTRSERVRGPSPRTGTTSRNSKRDTDAPRCRSVSSFLYAVRMSRRRQRTQEKLQRHAPRPRRGLPSSHGRSSARRTGSSGSPTPAARRPRRSGSAARRSTGCCRSSRRSSCPGGRS